MSSKNKVMYLKKNKQKQQVFSGNMIHNTVYNTYEIC
jgi:hypothetical protein